MNICMCVCMYVLYAYIRVCIHLCEYACMYICMHVCIHVCIYVSFKLGFERYGGGIVLVGRGIVRGKLYRGKCPGPLATASIRHKVPYSRLWNKSSQKPFEIPWKPRCCCAANSKGVSFDVSGHPFKLFTHIYVNATISFLHINFTIRSYMWP